MQLNQDRHKIQGRKSLAKFIFVLQMVTGNIKHIMLQQKPGQKAKSTTVTTGASVFDCFLHESLNKM